MLSGDIEFSPELDKECTSNRKRKQSKNILRIPRLAKFVAKQ